MQRIYVPFGKDYETVYGLLEHGFNDENNNSYQRGKFSRTYSNPECTQLQCTVARRSFGDIFYLCKTYFPNTTREEVAYNLLSIPHMRAIFCDDIGKLVFRAIGHNREFSAQLLFSETNFKGKDGVSLNDVRKYYNDYAAYRNGEPVELHSELE